MSVGMNGVEGSSSFLPMVKKIQHGFEARSQEVCCLATESKSFFVTAIVVHETISPNRTDDQRSQALQPTSQTCVRCCSWWGWLCWGILHNVRYSSPLISGAGCERKAQLPPLHSTYHMLPCGGVIVFCSASPVHFEDAVLQLLLACACGCACVV